MAILERRFHYQKFCQKVLAKQLLLSSLEAKETKLLSSPSAFQGLPLANEQVQLAIAKKWALAALEFLVLAAQL
jgi:hypothetical protein